MSRPSPYISSAFPTRCDEFSLISDEFSNLARSVEGEIGEERNVKVFGQAILVVLAHRSPQEAQE